MQPNFYELNVSSFTNNGSFLLTTATHSVFQGCWPATLLSAELMSRVSMLVSAPVCVSVSEVRCGYSLNNNNKQQHNGRLVVAQIARVRQLSRVFGPKHGRAEVYQCSTTLRGNVQRKRGGTEVLG